MKRFENQIVWITGAGSGIGKAMALEFAKRGAHLALSGRRAERLAEVATEIRALGKQAFEVPCDVTDEEAVHAAAEKIAGDAGGIDIVIANAGYGVAGSILKLDAAAWRRQLDVNVVGLATTVKAAAPHIIERKGRIVLVGSVMSMVAVVPNSVAYAASKYAVRAIGQSLAVELAGTGASCTTVYPGFVESEINQVDNDGVFHADREDRRPQKLMWTAEKAARVCADAIGRRQREFVFTGHGKFIGFVGRHAPSVAHGLVSMQRRRGK